MKKITMIGNTHFDPVWLWHWHEALSSILATFRSALLRMDENPSFHYSFSSPAVFEWVEKTDPDLMEKIKERVKEGRWELCEGFWVQSDCNLPCGESYVRQALYAQRFLESRFGKISKTVFNIDSFGHNLQLPQILHECEMENYVFWRPNEEQMHLPAPLFSWVGLDGTSCRAYRTGGIGGEIFTENFEEETFGKIFRENTEEDLMVVFGVTDHGGAPTKAQMAVIDRLAATRKDYDISYGTVEDFFAGVKPSAVVKDELQVTFIGPCANYIPIKSGNRRAECALLSCEIISTVAEQRTGRPYPAKELSQCWKDLLFNQFHDILGGTCIPSAYRDAAALHGRAIQTATELSYFALQSMANRVATPGKNGENEWNLFVFNPNGFAFNGPLEAEAQWAWEFPWYNGGLTLLDETGKEYPAQIITEECVVPSFRSRFVFRAEVPPCGYRCFAIRKTEKAGKGDRRFALAPRKDGGIDIYDKETNKTQKGLFIPTVREDICDTWGFNKTVYEEKRQPMTLTRFEKIEDGIHRTSYKAVYAYGKSSFTEIFRVYDDRILCEYRILWNEERKAIKLCFETPECTAEIPYGHLTRKPSPCEKPFSGWLWGADYTLAATDAFAYDFDGNTIGMTLLRNCLFGDLRTQDLDPNREYAYMGQGETTGTLLFYPERSTEMAKALQNPPLTLLESNHGGTWPAADSFFSLSGANLAAVKKAEDGENIIFRLAEETGKDTTAKLKVGEKEFSVALRGFEVATYAFDGNKLCRVNMLER